MISNDFAHIPIKDITVDRENRQRKTFTIDDILPSIQRRGVLMPLIIDRDMKLIAGERRLATAKFLGHETVPCRFFDSLSKKEQRIVELDENIRRKDLTWQEDALATLELFELELEDNPELNAESFGERIGMSVRTVETKLSMGRAIQGGDKAVKEASTASEARTILTRRASRAADETVNRILNIERPASSSESYVKLGSGENVQISGEVGADGSIVNQEIRKLIAEPAFSIQHADAMEFFKNYSGPKFNLLHCDFPYGVVLHGQANQDSFEGGGYDSNPEIYWALCEALVAGWDNFMLPSAHVVFWISMNFYSDTIEFLEAKIPGLKLSRTPLIWHKTDNRGIIPDRFRDGRNTYEAALFGATNDRYIVKPIAKSYGAPTAKSDSIHTNEKPEPMLAHFLSMVVDQHTRMLDPTCGSGSAIRVAEALGAEAALGLEHNEEFADRAAQRLKSARGLRALSANVKDTDDEDQ